MLVILVMMDRDTRRIEPSLILHSHRPHLYIRLFRIHPVSLRRRSIESPPLPRGARVHISCIDPFQSQDMTRY